ncbi:MAG: DoxX family protein [Candidatus Oceanisphaera merdipullorum]|nr:DoxX family protein [Candidatus Oceanisphaera merdipullorum]
MDGMLNFWSPRLQSVLRIITAFLFIQHGTQKMFGFPAPQRAPFELFSLMGAAGVLEVVGGLLLLIGLFTRPVAFVLSGQMAFAYFMVHAPTSFWPLLNNGELAVQWCFLFLFFAAAGGGAWSLDQYLSKKR